MLGVADLIKRIDQCVVAVRLEGDVQIDGRPRMRVAVVFPPLGNGVPRVLHPHVVPIFGGRMGNSKRGGDEDKQ
jgi:hypothetical protein